MIVSVQGIPDKGKLLTQLSLFWFNKLQHVIPNHFVTANIEEMPKEIWKYKDQLDGRAMLVRRAQVVPLEAIVRGYLVGTPLFFFGEIFKSSFKSLNFVANCQVLHGLNIKNLERYIVSLCQQVLEMAKNWKSLFSRHLPKPNRVHTMKIYRLNKVIDSSSDSDSILSYNQLFFCLSCETNRTRPLRQNIFSGIEVVRKSSRLRPNSGCDPRRYEI